MVVEDAVAEDVDTSAEARGLDNWQEFKQRLSESALHGVAQAEHAMEEGDEGQVGWQGAFSQCALQVRAVDPIDFVPGTAWNSTQGGAEVQESWHGQGQQIY